MGTQEAKRARKAMPPPLEHSSSKGCLTILTVHLAVCAAIFAATGWAGALVLGMLAVLFLALMGFGYLRTLALLARVDRKWTRRGVKCLVVYSNSPKWEPHIRSVWLPALGPISVVLNWSERASWPSGLAARVYRRFGSGRT